MRALDQKLVRDIRRLRGQVLAIALVVASGVAILVMSLSTLEALKETGEAYYERYRFAHVFALLKRAPEHVKDRIAKIDGVQTIETRIVEFATLDIAGFAEPVMGQLVSIPERSEAHLNRLVMRAGRGVHPGKPDEAVLNEPFAEAHGLTIGSSLQAIINGNKRTLRVVGIALSPEFIYTIGPGALMPDEKRFGVIWLGREALAAAFDLDGAFNSVSLTLMRGIDPRAVIERLDRLLDRFGGAGAYARKDQISNWFLMNELDQLRTMATILPTIFLAVAAFLANMVLRRLIATERSEIGLMKAFGYSNLAVGWHYTKMVIVIVGIGVVLGFVLGAGLGRFNTQQYAGIFTFPFLLYRPSVWAFAAAGAVSLVAALAGTISAVRAAVALPPAEAIRPPAPPLFQRDGVLSGTVGRWLDQSTRIILRQMTRWPLRSGLTAIGIAATVGVSVMTFQWFDVINHLITSQFYDAQRQTLTVGLADSRSSSTLHAFDRMPGVLSTQPSRGVSARFEFGLKSHRGSVEGVVPDAHLKIVHDVGGRTVRVPPRGLLLSTVLAEKLGVERGDQVTVKVLEGRRPVRQIPVVDTFETYIGTPAYMNLEALNRMLREPPSLQLVDLLVDKTREPELFAHLKDLPSIAAVTLKEAAVVKFNETIGKTILVFVTFFIGFACTLAFGVVYNSVRIALSERGRELATLRVLGFSRAEISYILLGEVGILVFIGLPTGCLVGYGLCLLMNSAFATELFRLPFVIEAATYGLAMTVALIATSASAALVRRRVDRLDLIAVLKTRE